MNLYHQSVWRRLQTCLAYYTKILSENRDKRRMNKLSHRINRLIILLERLNNSAMNKTIVR